MTEALTGRIVWVAALISMLTGVAMTVISFSNVGDTSVEFRRELRELYALNRLHDRVKRYESALKTFEELNGDTPVDLSGLLKETMAGQKADDIRESIAASAPGWGLVQKELTFREASLKQVAGFLHAAENPPNNGEGPDFFPWRLNKLVVRSSSRAPGRGQVVIQLEALTRQKE